MTERLDDPQRADKVDALSAALKLAMNSVECASINPATGEELPWYRAAKAALSITRSAVVASVPGGAYVPLTSEQIEKVRSVYKRHFSDGERLDTVCDMAINSLLFSQEIDRLRTLQSAITAITAEQLADVKDQCELGLQAKHECPAVFALAAIYGDLFFEENATNSPSDRNATP